MSSRKFLFSAIAVVNTLAVSSSVAFAKETYTVKQGDTLWQMAATTHSSVQAIKKLNNLNSDMIYIGQQLRLPSDHTTAINVYKVKIGDTLWQIARSNQTSVQEIKKLNHLRSDTL